MVITNDPAEMAKLNGRQLDRYLRWAGYSNPDDRADILQSFYLEICNNPLILLTAIAKKYFSSYIRGCLRNTACQYLRQKNHSWNEGPAQAQWPSADRSDYSAWGSDGTCITMANVYINDFEQYLRKNAVEACRSPHPHTDPRRVALGARTALACLFRLRASKSKGDSRSNAYKTFQAWRDRYNSAVPK